MTTTPQARADERDYSIHDDAAGITPGCTLADMERARRLIAKNGWEPVEASPEAMSGAKHMPELAAFADRWSSRMLDRQIAGAAA